jgi:hypothetical protein
MANQGASPIDVDTDVGKVRLLIGDTDASAVSNGIGTYRWYSDAEITAMLTLMGRVQRVAVHILRAVAYSTALKLKKWTSADLAVDGEAITAALLSAADAIEKGLLTVDAEQGGLVALAATGGRLSRWTRAELASSAWPLVQQQPGDPDRADDEAYPEVWRGII